MTQTIKTLYAGPDSFHTELIQNKYKYDTKTVNQGKYTNFGNNCYFKKLKKKKLNSNAMIKLGTEVGNK